MSPSQFYTKREINPNGIYPSHALKINKDSHSIKKSSSSLSASPLTPTLATKTPHREPVIIYTHPPKVIHTSPKDFMALVQKLTGLSDANGNPNPSPKKEPEVVAHGYGDFIKNSPTADNCNNLNSSLVTRDCCLSTILENFNLDSYAPPTSIFDTNTDPCFYNMPMFMPDDNLYSGNSFLNNYTDPIVDYTKYEEH